VPERDPRCRCTAGVICDFCESRIARREVAMDDRPLDEEVDREADRYESWFNANRGM
jgi:hypothetical protein